MFSAVSPYHFSKGLSNEDSFDLGVGCFFKVGWEFQRHIRRANYMHFFTELSVNDSKWITFKSKDSTFAKIRGQIRTVLGFPCGKLYLFLSLPVCPRSSLLQGRGGRGWGRSQIIWHRVSLVLYKSFNTPWYVHSYLSLSTS